MSLPEEWRSFFKRVSPIEDEMTTFTSSSKKTYGEFLTCRKQDKNNGIDNLIGCLQNRIRLELDKDSYSTKNTSRPQSPKRKRTSNESLFDTLLELINGFDAAGVAEIFRLLLERRSAVPLFSSSSKTTYLDLLRHITLPGNNNIRLGEDTTLMRVVLISCRQKEKSQTSEILKSLFHIHSMHTEDFMRGTPTSNDSTAEIGIGVIKMEEFGPPKLHNLLVVHVGGDFRPLWPFLLQFMDFVIIEDATNEEDSFYSMLSNRNKADLSSIGHICLWKPSNEEITEKRTASEYIFRHDYIECCSGELVNVILSFHVQNAVQEELEKSRAANEKIELHLIPILDGNFTPIACPSPTEIESSLAEIPTTLMQIKENEFILQQNFRKQAKFQEAVYEYFNNSEKKKEFEIAVEECLLKRNRVAIEVKDHLLLSLFQKLISINDPSSRVLSIRILEKSLATRSHREQLLLLENHNDDQQRDGDTSEATEIFSIELIWRELSLVHSALSWFSNPSVEILPRLAAQHLVDGFSLELVDGHSNVVSMHTEWMKHVFQQLSILIGSRKRERIFVLSVMGVQSSGKSTILNTMFGIQMRTSVGRCTRGVYMQLLAVEGRPEYDYILLLDTEGARAPEYQGLSGSEKRDNQMAALSILLADATIIVIPGENDAAIKEILPVVKLAYQGSKLAEENGGQLSSKMFFVYNRIDTTQKDKLNNIVKTLGTSLNEAFDLVENLVGKLEVPFRRFKLDTMSKSSANDVCILGSVKKEFEPPEDVPNFAFGESLVELREQIHRRVTTSVDGPSWRCRSVDQFSKCVEEVWKCICSANFTLSFASVMERLNFDQLDRHYKDVEQTLSQEYRIVFVEMKNAMVEEKRENFISSNNLDGNEERLLKSFEILLRGKILPAELDLDEKVDFIIKGKNHEKWNLQYEEHWKSFKITQSRNWVLNMKTTFNMLFKYGHHVDECQKKIRQEIVGIFGETVLQSPVAWSDSLKKEKFNVIYDKILTTIKEEYPIANLPELIAKVYENSNVIKKRQIGFQVEIIDPHTDTDKENAAAESSHLCSSNKKRTEISERNFQNCSTAIYGLVNKITNDKFCYDDSVISSVISETDEAIKSHDVTINSDIQRLHILGRQLVTESLKTIQDVWEAENSVYNKLQQEAKREAMFNYFKTIFTAAEKTNLFSRALALEWMKCFRAQLEQDFNL